MHAKVVGAMSFVVAGRPSCVSWKGGDGGGKKNRNRKESGRVRTHFTAKWHTIPRHRLSLRKRLNPEMIPSAFFLSKSIQVTDFHAQTFATFFLQPQ